MSAAAVLGISLSARPAWAIQTDTHGLHAVPAPRQVLVDGRLDEWDLSGETLMTYDVEALLDVYSARVSVMYDAQNLYVGIKWKDPLPLGNRHDPRYQAGLGWAGDATQLRFKTDRIAHVTAWQFAARNEPAISIAYGKDLGEPFGGPETQLFQVKGAEMDGGAAMAFAKDADNRGYTQEMRLPWKLISNRKYLPGESLIMGVELLWGEADFPVHRYSDNLQPGASSREFFWGAHNAWGSLTLEPRGQLKLPAPSWQKLLDARDEAPQGPIEITYALPKDARVSLAIEEAGENAAGNATSRRRVRNLIAAAPRKAGRNSEKWDGLDDEGKPVPPGRYAFRALYHDGIRVSYLSSFASPGSPSWDTADGRGAFYGDHTPPQAVASAGNYVALATPMGEAGKHLIGCDLSGQRLWGLPNRAAFDGGHISLATDGKILWVATEGKQSIIYRVDIATGQYTPWNRSETNAEGKAFQVLDLKVSEQPGMGAPAPDGQPNGQAKRGVNMTAIALSPDASTLAVCLLLENKILLLDSQTGAVKSQLAIPAPLSATFGADGNLIALSQGRLLRIQMGGNTAASTSPFSPQLFPDAYSLARDGAGNIYLSLRGDRQNVQVLSAAGKPLREIGERGGRPLLGAYKAGAMRNPAQIAIDSQNRLWVAEETMNPKRTSVWDTKSGRLLKDMAGTTTYAGAGALNPADPTMGFSNDTVYRLDARGASRPIYSLARRDDPADIFPPQADSRSRTIVRNGRTYHFTTGSARGSLETHCTMFDGKIWRSAAHLGVVPSTDNPNEMVDEWAKYKLPFFANQKGRAYAWADRNGDGLVQQTELQFAALQLDGQPIEPRSYYWGQLPDDEGTVPYLAPGNSALLKFTIASILPNGTPVYDIARPRIVRAKEPILGLGNGEGQIVGGSEGWVYLNQDPLIALGPDGTVAGGYPNKHTSVHGSHSARASRPGYLIGPSSIVGSAQIPNVGEVWSLNGNLGENYLFTRDGLWIQSLFKDTRGYSDVPSRAIRGMSMDAITAGGESFGGNFLRGRDGKNYLVIGGTDARVLEVSGLESIRRLQGSFSYTPAQYAQAQQIAQERAARANAPRVFTIARAPMPAQINGRADEWPELLADNTGNASTLSIEDSPQQRYGRVAMRYDADNLYLAYRVLVPRGDLQNAGQDWRLLFKTGDAIDLMIGPDQAGANSEGNRRLLLSKLAGQPIAILNQKNAPGAPAGEKFDFSSPWRTISFDRVAQAPDVKLATGSIEGGYFVEAQVPWQVLGARPAPGLKLRGDVGILLAGAGGTQTIARQYWSNKATGLVNDVPGEADLAPALWGTFVLE